MAKRVDALRALGEPRGDDAAVLRENGALRLDTLVARAFVYDLSGVRVQHSDLFVLAGGHELTAVVVEANAPDHIRMTGDFEKRLTGSDLND